MMMIMDHNYLFLSHRKHTLVHCKDRISIYSTQLMLKGTNKTSLMVNIFTIINHSIFNRFWSCQPLDLPILLNIVEPGEPFNLLMVIRTTVSIHFNGGISYYDHKMVNQTK